MPAESQEMFITVYWVYFFCYYKDAFAKKLSIKS